jgi:DNA repair photolyase
MTELGELYYPTGKALETAQQVLEVEKPMACNVAYGCKNCCEYCYIPYTKKGEIRFPKQNPRELIWKQLENGLKPEGVFLSFHTDPFIEDNLSKTIQVLDLLLSRNIKVAILSKVDTFWDRNIRTGMTIVSDNDDFSKRFEPNAKPFSFRLKSLLDAHANGFYTWVSIEPYPTPNKFEQSFSDLLSKIDFVDFMIFGKWNYDKTTNDREFYSRIVAMFNRYCAEQGIRHFVKSETRRFIERGN